MINALVVSKDRACQLRLLLESIKLNADNFFNQILIIYKGSNFLYEEGYRKLQAENILPNLAWQAEQDFVSDFKNAINGCGSHFICGIVDDCVFYKRLPITWQDVESAIQDDVFCFSLRLGLNTTLQYYMNPDKRYRLENYGENALFVKWNWKEWDSTLNYGYPISLDGHIFRTKQLAELTNKYPFDYLRQWEGVIAGKSRDDVPEQNMVSCKQNVLFSIATNCVQDPPLVAGLMYPYTEEYLNNKYLNDEAISLEGLEYGFQNVSWCHTEMPFRFNKIDSGEE